MQKQQVKKVSEKELKHLQEIGRKFCDMVIENDNHVHHHYYIAKIACAVLLDQCGDLQVLHDRFDIERLGTLNECLFECYQEYVKSSYTQASMDNS